jgi:hypothetical protein
MVIYLDQYRTTEAAPAAWLKNGTYGEEVMNAGWNPEVIHIVREPAPVVQSHELPRDLSSVNVDAFLDRVYGLATLI